MAQQVTAQDVKAIYERQGSSIALWAAQLDADSINYYGLDPEKLVSECIQENERIGAIDARMAERDSVYY